MQILNRSSQSGFSLIETLIVLVMVGVLTTFAVLQFRGAKTDIERQNIVREFKNYLERARFDSVKRRPTLPENMATITLTSPTSFTVSLDFDQNGTLTTAETRSVNFAQRSNTRISITDSLNYPVAIKFNRRGQATAVDATNTSVSSVFRICSNCASANPSITYLSISASGTISDSSSAPGVLPTPAVTENSNVVLNCYVLMTNSNTSCRMY